MALVDRRIGILFIAFVALLGIALGRAVYLGSVKARSLERAAATQQVSNVILPAPRGAITDRHGAELAISESADDVVADPYLIKDAVSASAQLSAVLGMPRLTVLGRITKPHTGYVLLAHLVPSAQAAEIAKLNIAGINLTAQMRRIYPWAARPRRSSARCTATARAPTASSTGTTACCRGPTECAGSSATRSGSRSQSPRSGPTIPARQCR